MHSNFSGNALVYVSQQKKRNFMSPPETLWFLKHIIQEKQQIYLRPKVTKKHFLG